MVSEEQFEQIMNRFDTLIKIAAINAFQGKSRADVIGILSELGFRNRDIAMILGTTAPYVAKVKHALKKKRKKKLSKDNSKKVERK